jgi:hypothetical protein
MKSPYPKAPLLINFLYSKSSSEGGASLRGESWEQKFRIHVSFVYPLALRPSDRDGFSGGAPP